MHVLVNCFVMLALNITVDDHSVRFNKAIGEITCVESFPFCPYRFTILGCNIDVECSIYKGYSQSLTFVHWVKLQVD